MLRSGAPPPAPRHSKRWPNGPTRTRYSITAAQNSTEAMLKKTSSASLDRSAVFQPQNKRVMRAGAPVGTFFGSSYSAIVLQPKPVVPGQRIFRRLGLLPASLWAKPQPQGRSRHGPVAFSQSSAPLRRWRRRRCWCPWHGEVESSSVYIIVRLSDMPTGLKARFRTGARRLGFGLSLVSANSILPPSCFLRSSDNLQTRSPQTRQRKDRSSARVDARVIARILGTN